MPVVPAFAGAQTQTQPANRAELADCIKTFNTGFEKLYYLTLAAINEQNYKIDEIQTKGGYILFTVNNKQKFLASIVYVSSSKSMLKITSCEGDYNFSSNIPAGIFNYIELNRNKSF